MRTKNNIKRSAFTLVELIVVIVILAILATIAFLTFWSQSSSARDGTRLSDLVGIGKWLSINTVSTWKYPIPDNNIQINSWAVVIGYQWEAWDNILKFIKAWSDGFIDPLDKTHYTYTVNAKNTKYQLLAFLENKWNVANLLPENYFDETSAFDYTNRVPYIKWDALWIVLTKTWDKLVPIQDNKSLTFTWIDITKSSDLSEKVVVINNDQNNQVDAWLVSYVWFYINMKHKSLKLY